MPSINIIVSQDWADRFEAMAKGTEPWDGDGPDTRTPRSLFLGRITRYIRRDIFNYEANIAAEAISPVDDPT